MLAEQEDFLRRLIEQVVQQVLESEMYEALSAGKGTRYKRIRKAGISRSAIIDFT